MTVPVIREHDAAVVDAISTTGRSTGLSQAPAGALEALTNPAKNGRGYYIVYPLSGGDRDGPVSDPYADVELVYQITCVDDTPEGARWLADQLEGALAGLTVPNRSVMWVTPTSPPGVHEDAETAAQSLFVSMPVFRIRTSP